MITTFEEVAEGTKVVMRIAYSSPQTRDEVLGSPMAEGIAINFGNLDELVAEDGD